MSCSMSVAAGPASDGTRFLLASGLLLRTEHVHDTAALHSEQYMAALGLAHVSQSSLCMAPYARGGPLKSCRHRLIQSAGLTIKELHAQR